MVAAVASYLDARAHGGQWLVRMEDLDPPREMVGAADDILRTLDGFGLQWDGAVMFQSRRAARYQEILDDLLGGGQAFGCDCTRAMLADASLYPGTCRGRKSGRAYRLEVGQGEVMWDDRLSGPQRFDLLADIGDFVLKRADGFWAYHLAVVMDDHDQQVTDVVRGADLLDSTARHLALMQQLNWPQPQYMHLPVVVNASGQKLSKQTLAPPVDASQPVPTLQQVFQHLGLPTAATPDLEATYDQATADWAVAFNIVSP
jgi:glutamyl-Q tRNA(Asp) synthetase